MFFNKNNLEEYDFWLCICIYFTISIKNVALLFPNFPKRMLSYLFEDIGLGKRP